MKNTTLILALSCMLTSTVGASITQSPLNSYQEVLQALSSGSAVSFILKDSSDCLIDTMEGGSERLLNDIRIFDIRSVAIESTEGLQMEFTIKSNNKKTFHEIQLPPPINPDESFSDSDNILIDVYTNPNQTAGSGSQKYTCSLTQNGGHGYVRFTRTNP